MSVFRRATAMKAALNFISSEAFPLSSRGFHSIRGLGGVSIPRPPPSKGHVLSRGFSYINLGAKDPMPNSRHWFVVVDPPEGNPTRDEIIDSYVKTLATVLGSDEEAKKYIYSVSTKHYFAFWCQLPQEISNKLEPLPNVLHVLPNSNVDPKTKSFGGEPFIDGQAVPYDPKYHEEWVRNNSQRGDGRSNRFNDRSRNFERRREMRQNAYQRPPESTYESPVPEGNTANTMQGAPDSQGRS